MRSKRPRAGEGEVAARYRESVVVIRSRLLGRRRRRVRRPGLKVANDAGTDQGQQKAQGNHHEERDQLSQRATLEHDAILHDGADESAGNVGADSELFS